MSNKKKEQWHILTGSHSQQLNKPPIFWYNIDVVREITKTTSLLVLPEKGAYHGRKETANHQRLRKYLWQDQDDARSYREEQQRFQVQLLPGQRRWWTRSRLRKQSNLSRRYQVIWNWRGWISPCRYLYCAGKKTPVCRIDADRTAIRSLDQMIRSLSISSWTRFRLTWSSTKCAGFMRNALLLRDRTSREMLRQKLDKYRVFCYNIYSLLPFAIVNLSWGNSSLRRAVSYFSCLLNYNCKHVITWLTRTHLVLFFIILLLDNAAEICYNDSG